jgi:hypothetical protein
VFSYSLVVVNESAKASFHDEDLVGRIALQRGSRMELE